MQVPQSDTVQKIHELFSLIQNRFYFLSKL